MRLFTFVVTAGSVAAVFSGLLFADPPGASVRTLIQVPAGLRSGIFAQDRYVNVPPGFQISVFALVPGARFLTVAPNGDVFVSQPGAGKITLLRPDPNGGVAAQYTYASGLNNAQGMAFQTITSTTYLYVSEANQVRRFVYQPGDTAAHDSQVVVPNLPGGGAHPLKNIAFDSAGKLYLALGSSCNVCAEDTASSPKRGAVYVYNADGSGGRLFAQGLRNAEGLAFVPGTDRLWAVVNSRDDMPYPVKDATGNYGKVMTSFVDNHPPDLFTLVRDGGNYGWPFCDSDADHGLDRMPFLPDYDTNRDSHVSCDAMDRPDKGIQAHSAPLGLLFPQSTAFAAPYRNGAVIVLHGSWDRSVPTGYKLIWYSMNGGQAGVATDLVTGFLDDASHRAWGRPVAAAVDGSGGLLFTDDTAGAVYRLAYSPAGVSAASGYAMLAPESLASVYGANLASQTASADSPEWPTTLAGVSVTVQDSRGTARQAPISYVSNNQINFEIPAGTATGNASLTVMTPTGPINEGTVTIAPVAPSLFSATGTAAGVAAASAVSLSSVGQTPVAVYSCANGPLSCSAVPIPLTADTPVFVSFFGTGIRGFSSLANMQVTIGGVAATVIYAGPQGTWPGLDQVNVALPLALQGAGQVDVVLTADGQTSNTVQLAVQ